MANFSIKVEGEKEIARLLKEFAKTSKKEAIKIVANSGEKIKGDAQEVTPVVEGRLRASLTRYDEDGGLTAVVGTNVTYAPFVEYGTRAMIAAHGEHDPENPVTDWAALRKRERKRGGSRQQMPFLTPAFLKEQDKFKDEIIKAIETEVQKRK